MGTLSAILAKVYNLKMLQICWLK